MQSQKSSTKEKRKPLPLPWGFGSMAFKGATWQITWRDTDGQIRYLGSGTADAAEAQRLLAKLALPRAQALVAQLERIANGEETYQGDGAARRKAAKPRAAGRDRGKAVRATRQSGSQGTRGEK